MTGTRSALIVASRRYRDPKLRQLRSPTHDAKALATVLGDPKIGAFDVDVSLDEPEHTVRRKLAGFFKTRGRDDLLLLHFSCHGVKDEDGNLYFATPDTELEHLDATAVPAEFVNRLMNRSPSRRIVLLLDCCYAGAFGRGALHRAGAGVELKERFDGRGRVVLTASNSMEYAFEGDTLKGEGTPSIFTSALVAGLSTGEADRDRDGLVSVDELYDYLYDRVRESTPNQTPSKWTYDLQGDLVVARNPEGTLVTPAAPTIEPVPPARPVPPREPPPPAPAAVAWLAIAAAALLVGAVGHIVVDGATSAQARALLAGPLVLALGAPLAALAWRRGWSVPELAFGAVVGLAAQTGAAAAGWLGASDGPGALLKDTDGNTLGLGSLRVLFALGALALVAAAVVAGAAAGRPLLDARTRGGTGAAAVPLAGAALCFGALFVPLRNEIGDRHEIWSEGAITTPWVGFEPIGALLAVVALAVAGIFRRGDVLFRAGALLALGAGLVLYFAAYIASVHYHAPGTYGPGGIIGLFGGIAIAAGALQLRGGADAQPPTSIESA